MKETIEYNYNIKIKTINEKQNLSSFNYNNDLYVFCFFNRDEKEINDLLSCLNELYLKKINPLQFMMNINKSFITKVGDSNYVLLKCPNNYQKNIDIVDILNYNNKVILSNKTNLLYRNNWEKLWSDKVDYFEYQISTLGKEKSLILDTFSYYIGLSENAIELVNHTIKKYSKTNLDKITLSHRRIYYPNYVLNYFNPLSFIFDLEVRDIAEYIKYNFFAGEDAFEELITFLKSKKLSIYSYQMFYARLLYPSYYFDLYEKVMNENLEQDEMLKVISKANSYEIFLKKAHLEISKYANIEKIEWLINLEED